MNDIPFKKYKNYDFYDDGKISPSRHSLMKVVEFVKGLTSAKKVRWWKKDVSKIVSIWDMWKESLKEDIISFDTIAHKLYDWGCEDFIICRPIGKNGKVETEEVVFARMGYGGWQTIGDEWNGRLMIPKSEN